MYNSGTLTLTGTTVTVGGADLHGGGIYNEGTLTVSGSTFSESYAANGNGGAIYNEGMLTVSGSTFSLNSSETDDSDVYGDGGAIYTSDTATITGSTFTSNEAQGLGGAIYADGGTVAIGNSTISGNTARSGGGAYLYRVDAAFDIVNTTVSGNTAGAGAGGGIAFDDVPGGLTIRHSTIAGNSATVAGGNLAVLGPAAAGGLFLRHTLVADGTAPGSPDLADTFDVQFSLIETPGTATIVNPVGNVTGVDPQLGALANNGGPTQTRLPGAASPAVNACNVAFAPPPTTDQRGLPRVADGRIDIGSVERTPVAPTIAYDPTPGTAVGFTGVTTIGTTGSGTIVATPSGGSGTAAGATTTVNGCTLGGANPGSFAGAAAVNLSFVGDTTTPQNLNLTCTSHQTAQTATLTCNETRGAAAPAQRLWPLSCPAGTLAPTTSTPVSGSTVNLTGVAGGININTSTITVSNPNPVVVSLTCTAPAFPFTATPLAFSVPASGNAPVTVGISPAAAGTYSGTLSCNVSGSSQVLTFNLAGTLMPAVMVPATSLWSLLAMMLALFGFAAVAARRQG